jgi:hypothetical protein
VATNAVGATNGLGIIWNPQIVSRSNLFSSHSSLTAQDHLIHSFESIFLTNVYGPNLIHDKINFLSSIQSINHLIGDAHWLIGGDFNIINSLAEMKGGIRRLD